ncbi:hypothetical protein A3Q56_03621 [Intoshia linei]|uniref:Uncharacterized protein n=1 Tax=Intoshia linei TaxID=1819745 RepID=A0A177B4F3_9BILA|nr:hypothetical protein A3Q56_03621 [Intoshia linei]
MEENKSEGVKKMITKCNQVINTHEILKNDTNYFLVTKYTNAIMGEINEMDADFVHLMKLRLLLYY